MRDFLAFRKMVTPAIIQGLWLGLSGLIVLACLMAFMASFGDEDPWPTRALAVVIALLGPFALRLYFELGIVIFKIHESLVQLVNGVGQLVEATEDQLEATEDAMESARV